MQTEPIVGAFLTIQEAAERLRASPRVVKDAILAGELRAAKLGRSYVIRQEALTEWIKEKEGRDS